MARSKPRTDRTMGKVEVEQIETTEIKVRIYRPGRANPSIHIHLSRDEAISLVQQLKAGLDGVEL